MARQEKVVVNDQKFTLQSVSPSWYYDTNDECGMTSGGKREVRKYMDTLFKNVVISPAEVKADGLGYFDDQEDIKTPELLLKEIERFLRAGKKSSSSAEESPTK